MRKDLPRLFLNERKGVAWVSGISLAKMLTPRWGRGGQFFFIFQFFWGLEIFYQGEFFGVCVVKVTILGLVVPFVGHSKKILLPKRGLYCSVQPGRDTIFSFSVSDVIFRVFGLRFSWEMWLNF